MLTGRAAGWGLVGGSLHTGKGRWAVETGIRACGGSRWSRAGLESPSNLDVTLDDSTGGGA